MLHIFLQMKYVMADVVKHNNYKSFLITFYLQKTHSLDGKGMAKTVDILQKFLSAPANPWMIQSRHHLIA